ncbi:MAG: peptide chain release factor N(5)-glutamine methyltransferase [Thermomicrobiales bacterium]
MHRNDRLDPAIAQQFALLIERRAKREPVAYIVGDREFLGLDFAVGPGALVPRPETEQLVEWAAAWLAGKEGMIAVDVGTGSGAIAIGIARFAPAGSLTRIIAVDPSADALAWARKNAARLAPDGTLIDFVQGSLLDQIAGPVDLVLANLPYLTPEQTDENPDLAMEPRSALVSGADGLDLIRELLGDLPRVLTERGAAILELDPSQAETVAALARAAIPDATVAIVRDLSGRDRFVTIER